MKWTDAPTCWPPWHPEDDFTFHFNSYVVPVDQHAPRTVAEVFKRVDEYRRSLRRCAVVFNALVRP